MVHKFVSVLATCLYAMQHLSRLFPIGADHQRLGSKALRQSLIRLMLASVYPSCRYVAQRMHTERHGDLSFATSKSVFVLRTFDLYL